MHSFWAPAGFYTPAMLVFYAPLFLCMEVFGSETASIPFMLTASYIWPSTWQTFSDSARQSCAKWETILMLAYAYPKHQHPTRLRIRIVSR